MTSFLDHFELSLADVSAGQRVPIPLFPIGSWTSAKYPELNLNRELADELIAGFEAGLLGTEPVLDSSGSHNTAAPAAGWFKKLYVAPTKSGGEMLFGDAELTALGAQMLNDGLYKYDSIEIGSVVDNATGAKTDNVFRSATLTNTPVLRMLPPVLSAADSIAVALSEITALREDHDGSPVERDPASSDAVSQDAKADEGQPVALSEGHPVSKGCDQVNPAIIKALKLAEGADEAAVAAAVVTLSENLETALSERDTEKAGRVAAEAKLAETEKAAGMAAFTAALDEKIEKENTIATGERGFYIEMAEEHLALAEKAIAQRTVKVIDLSERGSDSEGAGSEYADVTVELAETAKARAKVDGITYAAAEKLVLSENENDIATRYHQYRLNPGKEA